MRALHFPMRGLLVASLVAAQLAIWLVGWVALLVSLRGKARRQAWFADRLRALLRGLGATYVKVGQIMSTRPDLLPPHIIRGLETLQDDVGAFAFRDVARTFQDDFGRAPEDVFARFDRAPIASASVAQVHRAVLPDGREVAVKVRRPRVEQIVSFDLAVMRLAARAVALVPSFRLLAPVESVDEFGRAIRTQIDLTVEAANNRRFRANFAGDADVELPELVPELCSRRVLTMSFLRGAKLLEYERMKADPSRIARIGFRLLLRMVFEHGFVHADLHPGNILVTERGTVALLDLGLTAELDEHHRRIFALYFAAWAQGDGATMARLMADFSPSAAVVDYAGYQADIQAFVTRYHGKALGEVAVSQVVFDMMGILRRHRVRVNATFTMVNIAIAVTEGIGKQLDPRLDLLNEAIPFFARLHAEAKL
ncbi:MAG TPA: AarF/UbiB family protein [Kofleriaceae bacterium]|nr:AarF/UbiB family protein [Kofleriaceae bacterium]